ncbi:PTS sugar transporter subunit IIC [Listeria booriae]|uniref:PTS sugar transporter subunit IIC n=1 Tax=Listeria booriae TaxID=1552123 RepID=A0A7X1C027_9LIST|nr:PTS sugar transporter subunit IIC [Listeria booriae]MBC1357257.1 PTS sugar transporter subunit IIC [Listeria booriae]MBC2115930.1 PTS sugar transporter subunit IIC [Listeria booriae]MBC2179422.1 PTS sugar transporter subunit IIC [Listeria booriae]MDT0110035.1 PTS sugar transporter subunit IIC [Listeria booriae]
MLLECILLALWAGICTVDERTFWFGTPKALIAGSVAGIIMGDITTGLIISGTLQMMWLANSAIGAYIPPNEATGSIIGVAIAIMSGGGLATGLAVAIPTALLCQQIIMLTNTLNIIWIHRADKAVQSGDFDKVARYNLLGIPLSFVAGAVPVFVAAYFGGPAVESALKFIPEQVFDGLTVAAGIIPAVGMGMLLMMMMGKNMWIFLLLGFVFAAYLDLGTIAISILGICFAVLYDLIINKNEEHKKPVNSTIDEEYDL